MSGEDRPDEPGAPPDPGAPPEPGPPSEPGPPLHLAGRTRDPRETSAVLAIAFLVGVFVLYVLATFAVLPIVEDFPRAALTLAQVAGLLAPSLAFLALMRSLGIPTVPPPPPRAAARRHVGAILGVAVTGLFVSQALHVLVLSWLAARGWAWVETWWDWTAESFEPLLRFDGPLDVVTTVLILSVVPAICEETTFRRCVQGTLSATWPASAAIAVTATAFSAFHVDPLGLVARIFLGVSIGVVYHRTQSLLAAGVVHAVHNGLAVAMTAAAPEDSPINELPRLEPTEAAVIATIGLVALVAWGLCVRTLQDGETERTSPAST